MKTVRINASKAYDVVIGRGLLEQAGTLTAKRTGVCKVALVSDDRVDALYGEKTADSLGRAGFTVCRYRFAHGEASKDLENLEKLLEFLAGEGLTRSDLIAALGGGVTGDLAGFAASVYLRGIRFVQFPTTVLAAVDSSVGGKTAVNLTAGKNLCGSFYQPELVLCDPGVFATLPAGVFSEGIAESLKYGVICDRALFDSFLDARFQENLDGIIARCVGIKGEIVSRDEFDAGERQLLNLGHTIGHAVEKLSRFQTPHGHAVAIGMAMMARAADRLGWSEENTAGPICAALSKHGLPVSTPYGAGELAAAALSDKKRRGERITLVAPKKIGRCFLKELPVSDLEPVIRAATEGKE